MTPDEIADARLRGYHGIPDDEKLKTMPDIELDSLLHYSKDNPVKAASLAREIQRRKVALSSPPKSIPSFWFHPLTKTIPYVAGVVVAAAIVFFLGFKK